MREEGGCVLALGVHVHSLVMFTEKKQEEGEIDPSPSFRKIS
jgi:hypothetical protein